MLILTGALEQADSFRLSALEEAVPFSSHASHLCLGVGKDVHTNPTEVWLVLGHAVQKGGSAIAKEN